MTPRHPQRDIPTVKGRDLPPLARHHYHRRRPLPREVAPPGNDHAMNKPSGGLWAAPVVEQPGRWRPVLRQTTWSADYLDVVHPDRRALGYHTRLHPTPDAEFVIIDSAADAVAVHAAFPDNDNAVSQLLALGGMPDTILGCRIDWAALAASGIAGVYLTRHGQRTTRYPEDRRRVPSLNGWDVASVWFARPEFRRGSTWPVRPIPVDDDGLTARQLIERIRREEYPRLRQEGVEGLMTIDAVEELAATLGIGPQD
jgi:hypothetical protein